jgi:hypothetical protein
MKSKKYYVIATIPKANIIIVDGGQIDTSNTQAHGRSLFWLRTGTSIKSDGIKPVI